jgi:hypothetical protein
MGGLELELLADLHDPSNFTAPGRRAFLRARRGTAVLTPNAPSDMLPTNRAHLVAMHVAGEIAPASVPSAIYDVGHDGRPRVLPSVGGICLNVRVGDNAFTPVGDHIEPAVSSRAKDDAANIGYCVLACVGNRATVLSGDAKGETGTVTGKHGGIEHVMIDFNERVMAKLTIGDRIGIRAVGVGLELTGRSDVSVFNCDPDFFDRLGITEDGGALHIAAPPWRAATMTFKRSIRRWWRSTVSTTYASATSSPLPTPTIVSAASTARASSASGSSRTATHSSPATARG